MKALLTKRVNSVSLILEGVHPPFCSFGKLSDRQLLF